MLGFKKLIMHFFHSLYISFGTDKEYLFSDQTVNPPTPPLPNISFFILYTLLYSFPLVLTWRICLAIKAVDPSPTPPPPPPTFPLLLTRSICLAIKACLAGNHFLQYHGLDE